MGLDDLTDEVEGEVAESEVEELTDKLGIEDKQELEELDDRLSTMFSMYSSLASTVDEIEKEVKIHKKVLGTVLEELEEQQ